ncbi:hypothetical protein [Halomonas daqiaonensis]|uniref:Uncharacterized protein n=1 Tax=Halomonas daqiaonensis TaxID=650850 RepID=A0A1H7VC53_9GAMM|nr:hypothetical protein [Halomonas daqiaonensis]SEM06495.1 hypothetical protein SAMN04488129_12421 [Halomonas daqiaonensis]
MDLISNMNIKALQLQKKLRDRKFAINGIAPGPSLEDIEDDIFNGVVNPKEYWRLDEPEILDRPMNLTEEMCWHWFASQVQEAYFRHLMIQYYSERKDMPEGGARIKHHIEISVEMAESLGWGFYHWACAEDFCGRRERAHAEKVKSGGNARSLKRNEEDVILIALVKAQLEHHPDAQRGWADTDHAARTLAKAIERIAEEQHFPVRQKGDKLMDEIYDLLEHTKDVKSVYDKFDRSKSRPRK